MTPEALAREAIDALREAAVWTLQNAEDRNRNAARGVAIREFTLPAGRAITWHSSEARPPV